MSLLNLQRSLILVFFLLSGYAVASDDFESYRQSELSVFEDSQDQLQKEFERYSKVCKEQLQAFSLALSQIWPQPQTSSQHRWVWYSEDLLARVIVDYQHDSITVEVVDNQHQLVDVLKHVLTLNTSSAFNEDAVEKAMQESLALSAASGGGVPLFAGYVQADMTEAQIDKMARDLLASASLDESVSLQGKKIHSAKDLSLVAVDDIAQLGRDELASVSSHANYQTHKILARAQAFVGPVDLAAEKYQLDRELILAVMETESSFNPMARSPIPAYGLMQIVPHTAGIDAASKVFGERKLLAPEYLYDAMNNIELGSAYLNILYYRYLRKIQNKESRLYLAIASYNTGTTNAVKALTGIPSVSKSAAIINTMSAEQVYSGLIENLPALETQLYLKKIIARMDKYNSQTAPL